MRDACSEQLLASSTKNGRDGFTELKLEYEGIDQARCEFEESDRGTCTNEYLVRVAADPQTEVTSRVEFWASGYAPTTATDPYPDLSVGCANAD